MEDNDRSDDSNGKGSPDSKAGTRVEGCDFEGPWFSSPRCSVGCNNSIRGRLKGLIGDEDEDEEDDEDGEGNKVFDKVLPSFSMSFSFSRAHSSESGEEDSVRVRFLPQVAGSSVMSITSHKCFLSTMLMVGTAGPNGTSILEFPPCKEAIPSKGGV